MNLTKNDEDFIKQMLQGYAECAEWADTPEDFDEEGKYDGAGFCESAKKTVTEDCRSFYIENKELIMSSGMDGAYVGHNLWLTAGCHGSGFWDRGLGEVGDKLAAATNKVHGRILYIKDDGFLDLD